MRTAALTILAAVMGLAGCSPQVSVETWQRYEDSLTLRGKLRTDRIAADIPFSKDDLADHFSKVAFGVDPEFEEDKTADQLASAQMVRKWRSPIRYRILGNPPSADLLWIEGLFQRLPGLIDVQTRPITFESGESANFLVFFYDARQRADLLDAYDRADTREARAALTDLFSDRSICAGIASHAHLPDDEARGVIRQAMVFIRAELPDRLRTSCIEEEVIQTLGLIRDDDSVRPSIFNEDEEFAYLTNHDEYLLRILYDPRIKPGMSPIEAMPLVRQIAAELDLSG